MKKKYLIAATSFALLGSGVSSLNTAQAAEVESTTTETGATPYIIGPVELPPGVTETVLPEPEVTDDGYVINSVFEHTTTTIDGVEVTTASLDPRDDMFTNTAVIQETQNQTMGMLNYIQSGADTATSTGEYQATYIPVESGETILSIKSGGFNGETYNTMKASLKAVGAALVAVAGYKYGGTGGKAEIANAANSSLAADWIDDHFPAQSWDKMYLVRSWSSYYDRYIYRWYITSYSDSGRTKPVKIHLSRALFSSWDNTLYW
ncbi:hypothetical protein COJ46_21930 [Bacillus sp. AFS077874]|uniref:hypothetical protein n=1 Tax=unclassified Bacillus (in: firmicutes) TaxID=185979 RepID=UPI000BF377A5|nr:MULTISPECIES: hypothetical protein [unclassified Bacillus (in: firmicutes)]PET71587.1 hypothetical protein CN514_06660 [Bacillus sp. AFS001701]PFM75325.1 hypothetical protein COJ46_21930 [Bacillus sp. AFS077874]